MHETEALIRRYYDAFNAKDWQGMLACLSDDVHHDVNEGEPRRGRPAFRRFLEHMERCYDERLDALTVMVDSGGRRAAAEFIVHGRYLSTDAGLPPARGQVYELPAGAFFHVGNGKIMRVTTYYNLNNWLKQVARPF